MKYHIEPVEKDKLYEVTIDAQGQRGDGIAHVDGFVIFVKGGKAGEKCKIKINAVHRNFALAEVSK